MMLLVLSRFFLFQVNVFVVNYKGLPFMQGLTDNRFLMWSLSLCGMGAFIAASNTLPFFNAWLQLTEYPSDSYQTTFLQVLAFNMCGTFLWDRLMLALFAPHIFAASIKAVTFAAVIKVVRILGIIAFVFYIFRDISLEGFEELE
jgi:cation-transporting ATPase 13A1